MQLRCNKLDFSGGQFRIGFLALEDLAFHGDDEFAARLLGFGMRGGLRLLVEDHLDDAGAVADIEKEQIAQVAAACDPAHHNRVAPFVFGAQFAAVVCALQVSQKVEQVFLSSGGTDFSLCSWDFLTAKFRREPQGKLFPKKARVKTPATTGFFANVPANPLRCTFPASRPPASSASTNLRILHYRRDTERTSRRV